MANILLVEDDDQIRASYAFVLTKKGYTVTEAQSGNEALRHVQAGKKFDLILLDMLMPEGSGVEFLKGAQLPAMSPDTRVIALSNTESPKIIEESKGLGVNRYVLKVEYDPYQLAELVATELADPASPPPATK